MMLPEGSYLAQNPVGGMDTRGANNTPFMVVALDIVYGSRDGSWHELQEPAKRSLWLATTDGAWPYTEKKLRAMGFNGDFREPEFIVPADDNGAAWVEVICRHEEYEGKIREKWELAKWGDQDRTPPADDVIRKLQAKWKQGDPGYSERPTPPDMPHNDRAPQAPPEGAPATPSGDDVPF